MEILKRRFQQQQEEEMEQKAIMKKASDKRVCSNFVNWKFFIVHIGILMHSIYLFIFGF